MAFTIEGVIGFRIEFAFARKINDRKKQIADFIFERLIDIRKQSKLTILLVEQRVAEALESADHGYVLEAGRVALEGNNQTLRADDRVRKAYLGM